MAAGIIVVPSLFPARDRNGRLVAGALMAVFQNRTTTFATVYADSALTTPLANPVVANSSGHFPIVWAQAGTVEAPTLYTLAISGPGGLSIANPSVFHDWQPSLDADTASTALAEQAAASAEDAYLSILAMAADAPDAPSVANKVNLDAGNLSDPAQRAAFKAGADIVSFKTGPSTPVAGSRFSADWTLQLGSQDGTFQGGAWVGPVRAGTIKSKTFEGFTNTLEAPCPGDLSTVFMNGTGPNASGVGQMAIATAMQTGDCVFGFNFLANAGFGVSGTRLIGGEIDCQGPAGGTVAAGSAGVYINAFNSPNMGSAIQIEGLASGYFTDGVKVGQLNPTTGAALSMSGAFTIGSLVNTSVGSYAQAGVVIGNGYGPGIQINGATTSKARIHGDGDFLIVNILPNGLFFKDTTGTTTLGGIQNDGSFTTQGNYKVAGTKVVGAQGAAVANATDAASAITQLNALLARMRAHGLIAL